MFEDEEDYDSKQRDELKLTELEERRLIAEIMKERMEIPQSENELKISTLYGGFSGSKVFRIEKCKATFSILGKLDCDLPKCVIKVNTKSGFDREARNYGLIPQNARRILCPVDTNDLRSTRGTGIYYLISKDLLQHDTLFNIICNTGKSEKLRPFLSTVFKALTPFYAANIKKNEFGICSKVYFSKIQETAKRIEARNVFSNSLLGELGTSIRSILKMQGRFDPPYTTVFHGDLNARNIMIRKADLDVKLIDFDHLNPCGDYIYDLGELLCHLTEMLPIEQTYEIELPQIALEKRKLSAFLRTIMLEEIEKVTKKIENNDDWQIRLLLSEARFLLTCASHIEGKKQARLCGKRALEKLKEILK